jgi:hypothetical protein
MRSVVFAECHIYALYAECRYAECCYAECHGAHAVSVINHFYFYAKPNVATK